MKNLETMTPDTELPAAHVFDGGRKVVVLDKSLRLSFARDASKVLCVGDTMQFTSEFVEATRVRVKEIETRPDGSKFIVMETAR